MYSPLLKKILENKVFHYIFSRYATYLIQFINSIFIAVYLGPYYLGIWGFITLIIQYLNQLNMGIAHSVNAIISIQKNREWYVRKVIGTSVLMLLILSTFVALFFLANDIFNLKIGNKYNFSVYAPAIALIGILAYFNTLFSNIFRVYGRVIEIAINQSAFPILMLVAIITFKGDDLLWALVGANLAAFLLSFCLYLLKMPLKIKPLLIVRLIKLIQIKGWYLFVYNTSFYLIVISTRSFVSAYYPIEEFGFFTFAFSLANVVLLLLQSFSFLIYPKLLNRMASATNEKILDIITTLRNAYITTSHFVGHVAILLFPLFLVFFPQYSQSEQVFKLITLTVILYTNSFGYSGLLIAKNLEKRMALLSFLALSLNILVAFILIKIFQVPFTYIISATTVAYFVYISLITYYGRKTTQTTTSFAPLLKDILPFRLFVPYLISLSLIIAQTDNGFFLIPLLLFIFLNGKILLKTKDLVHHLLIDPNLINI